LLQGQIQAPEKIDETLVHDTWCLKL